MDAEASSALLSLEATTTLNEAGLFPSHPCFNTFFTDYILKHLHKAIKKGKYVCALLRRVNLMYLACINAYHIPKATAETDFHTFLTIHSMIYDFGPCNAF